MAEALPVAPKFLWVDLSKVVRDPALIAKVKAAKGIFFTGGVQERIVDVLQPGGQTTPMLEAIWYVYRKGGVVAGTSAGAAIMSTIMFRDAPSVINVLKGRFADGKQVDRGLGFVGPHLFVDQHFLKRGRFGRRYAAGGTKAKRAVSLQACFGSLRPLLASHCRDVDLVGAEEQDTKGMVAQCDPEVPATRVDRLLLRRGARPR